MSNIIDELEAELQAPGGTDVARIKDELGDVLFSLVNVARKLDMDPEDALRQANTRFQARYTTMERLASERDLSFLKLPLAEKEKLWQEAKGLTGN